LKQKGKSGRAEVGAKSERAEREFKGKLPPFSWFFFGYFLVCFFFIMFEKKKMTLFSFMVLL
jgi:hypothetical protein